MSGPREVKRRGDPQQLPEALERMGILLYERLHEHDPQLEAKNAAVVDRIAAIAKAIRPVGIELATKREGDVLVIAVFPQTTFRSWAEATDRGAGGPASAIA